MRRPTVLAALVVPTLVTAIVLSGQPAGTGAAPDRPSPPVRSEAQRALTTVEDLLTGPPTAGRGAASERPDATLALRDLFVALPRLAPADRSTARRLLARPGATSRSCDEHVCVHWSRGDTRRSWVRETLRQLGSVWATEVDRLGYRPPYRDGRRGGDGHLDVYLQDVGSQGLYGYCAPERRVRGQKWLASGYCVLDDDFARSQYGAPPRQSLRATAAHEFFHVVQFAYDYAEDPWLMEASATWMEERVADAVDDNRQYLPYGQVGTPSRSLDRFERRGYAQYGNWAFLEHLSQRFGVGVVRSIWARAGAYPGAGGEYSTRAVARVLARHGGFRSVFRAYAGANTTPARSYAEGRSWPTASPDETWRLGRQRSTATTRLPVDHLASRTVEVRPASGLEAGWRLRVRVDGPARVTAPAALVVSRTRAGVERQVVALDRRGRGSTVVGFDGRRVAWVEVVLVNASTRFSCWHRTTWSCQGRPRDDGQLFALRASALPPRR